MSVVKYSKILYSCHTSGPLDSPNMNSANWNNDAISRSAFNLFYWSIIIKNLDVATFEGEFMKQSLYDDLAVEKILPI
jgi:hypothetical protein